MSSAPIESVRVRPAVEADYDALCALWREMDELHARLLPSYFRRPRHAAKTPAELAKLLRSASEAIRVAEVDGSVVAFLHVQLYDTPPAETLTPRRRAHVETLVVAAEARLRGIGRRLMEEAEAWGRDRGAVELVLTVWAGNDDAEEFYRRLGFTAVNRVLGREIT
ncbi:MAG TPA: GNAT family N-acetyltransferase [Haliangiales bacterium]|nr:GNAT family N-acetyltransferase [Haliangiales bacterium]